MEGRENEEGEGIVMEGKEIEGPTPKNKVNKRVTENHVNKSQEKREEGRGGGERKGRERRRGRGRWRRKKRKRRRRGRGGGGGEEERGGEGEEGEKEGKGRERETLISLLVPHIFLPFLLSSLLLQVGIAVKQDVPLHRV